MGMMLGVRSLKPSAIKTITFHMVASKYMTRRSETSLLYSDGSDFHCLKPNCASGLMENNLLLQYFARLHMYMSSSIRRRSCSDAPKCIRSTALQTA